VKKFYEVDCRCVSWEFGKNKNAARMGRVNVVGFLEDGTRVECGVGSGWTDDQRQDVMDRWDSFWQYAVIEVKYQEVSKGKNKEFSSLRFPTFNQRIRDDKNVEI
jgi:ATP-dependent DNA ligase